MYFFMHANICFCFICYVACIFTNAESVYHICTLHTFHPMFLWLCHWNKWLARVKSLTLSISCTNIYFFNGGSLCSRSRIITFCWLQNPSLPLEKEFGPSAVGVSLIAQHTNNNKHLYSLAAVSDYLQIPSLLNFLSLFLTLLSFIQCPHSDLSFWTLQSFLHLTNNTRNFSYEYTVFRHQILSVN